MQAYINNTKNRFRIIALKGVMLMGFGLAGFIFFLPKDEPLALLVILGTSVFLIACMLVTIKNIDIQDTGKAFITVDERGLYDRRLFKQPIPWDNLEWRFYTVKGNPSISVNILNNEDRYVLLTGRLKKFEYFLANLFRMPKHNIDLMCLTINGPDIRDECEKYKPQM